MKGHLTAVATLGILGMLVTGAFAQSTQPNGTANSSSQSAVNSSKNAVASEKIAQDLQAAGFTDVKVVAESFVVQAKSKDGDPVLMTIGPHGMSVFEAMDSSNSGSDQSTTGSTNTTSPTNSPSSHRSPSQAK